MYCRLALPLAYISVLTGCVASPPKGAFVEYRDGQTPVTQSVKYEATYELCAADQPPGTPSLTAHQVVKGERIGFCRAADGSVAAVAPGYSLSLPPGAYSWRVVPGSGPSSRERAWCQVREGSLVAGRVALIVVGVTLLLILIAGVLMIIAFASSDGFNW